MKSTVIAAVVLSSALLSGCAVYEPVPPGAVVAPAPVVVAPSPYYYGTYYYGGNYYGGNYYGGHRYWR